MIGSDQLSETLLALFSRPNGGVAGLVDDLLPICLDHNIELELDSGGSRVRPVGGSWEELKNVSLPRPVFRAVLARLAALCSQQGSAASPYGGDAKISINGDPKQTLHVIFCNTATVQRLTVCRDVDE